MIEWPVGPFGPALVTLAISVVWLAIVVFARVRQPILTLVLTGVSYAVFTLILSAILSPILTGELSGPFSNPFLLPFAFTAILVTNALWGLLTGLAAWGIQKILWEV